MRRINYRCMCLLAAACWQQAAAGPELANSTPSETSKARQAADAPPPAWRDVRRNPSLKALDGLTHNLEEWRGKVVVLNFWATWCPSCLYEIPDLINFQRRYRDRGLQIIGIGMDDERKLGNVRRTLGINYPVLVAPPETNAALMAAWGNKSGVVPYTVILNRAGNVASTYRGTIDAEEFEGFIKPLLR